MPKPTLTEAAFQQQVMSAARFYGWHVFHHPDSRRTAAGWPDLAMVKPLAHRLILAELKSETGRVRPEQTTIVTALDGATVTAGIYRPSDFQALVNLLKESA
jgi:hypothetical protein